MKAIELFAGAGGAALGLEAAGFEHLALCEWDPDACATLRAAGLGPVVEGDVRDLDAIEAVAFDGAEDRAWNLAGDELLDVDFENEDEDPDVWPLAREARATEILADLRRVDLLWSSFPCQAFSTAGKRLGAGDERNGWPWTVDAIDRFKPAWFLGENVKGLLMHREGCTARGGQLGIFGTAAPEDCPGCYFERRILPDLRARFDHVGWWLLDAADYGVPQHRRRVILWAGPAPVVEPAPTHGPGCDREWYGMPDALGWTADQRARWPGPSPTVTTTEVKGTRASEASGGTFSGGPDRASDALYLATGRRRLTVDECARLQDFPADHPWQGNSQARYRQVGNACPPALTRVVVKALMRAAQE